MNGIRALDLGCGGGRLSHFMRLKGADVTACDISMGLVEVTQLRLPAMPLAVNDAAALCYGENSFDLVAFAYNGLDYLNPRPHRLRALEQILYSLKSGGLFLFSSHSFGGISFGLWRHWRKPKTLAKALIFAAEHAVRGNLLAAESFIPDIVDGVMTYYAWPHQVLSDCRSVGFEVLAIYPNLKSLDAVQHLTGSNFPTRWFEPWPYYVCRKP